MPAWTSGLLLVCLASLDAANAGPNANLLRRASGRYVYRTLRDVGERGVEAVGMLVRMLMERFDLEYLLNELDTTQH